MVLAWSTLYSPHITGHHYNTNRYITHLVIPCKLEALKRLLELQFCNRYRLVLCDTHDTSILTVDTDVTMPVSPRSRYTAVYRRTNNYRETTQLHASRRRGVVVSGVRQ